MTEKTYTNKKYGSTFKVRISYNESTNMIEVYSHTNSYCSKFDADDLEKYIELLNYARDYEQYYEESDEYSNPDELELDIWFAECSGFSIKKYNGNWIETYQIPSIIENVNDFANEICLIEPTKGDIKSLGKDDLNKYSICRLKSILKMVQDKPSKASV